MNKITNNDYDVFLKIVSEVSEITGISVSDIKGKNKKTERVKARMLVSYFCRKYNFSLKFIALCMGNRNHTTIINQLEKLDNDIRYDRELKRLIIDLNPIIDQRVCDLSWVISSGTL